MTVNVSFSVFQYFTVTSLLPLGCLLSISLLSRWWVIYFHILPHSYFFLSVIKRFISILTGNKCLLWPKSEAAVSMQLSNFLTYMKFFQYAKINDTLSLGENCSTSTNLDSFTSLHTLLNYSIIFCFDHIFAPAMSFLWKTRNMSQIFVIKRRMIQSTTTKGESGN